jgi:hypothetical protein
MTAPRLHLDVQQLVQAMLRCLRQRLQEPLGSAKGGVFSVPLNTDMVSCALLLVSRRLSSCIVNYVLLTVSSLIVPLAVLVRFRPPV